jgi:hypothetical protein
MRRPVSGRDAVYAPKLSTGQGTDKKETGNAEVSTVAARQSETFSPQKRQDQLREYAHQSSQASFSGLRSPPYAGLGPTFEQCKHSELMLVISASVHIIVPQSAEFNRHIAAAR